MFFPRAVSTVSRSAALVQSARQYASASTTVQVPLNLHGIDGRYATALFTAASKKKALDAVEADLTQVKSLLQRDPKLRSFLETPLADRNAKLEGVKSILAKGKYSELTQNFFNVLADNGRLDQTSKIIAAYEQLLTAARGEVAVTVTSAKELDAKLSRQLRDILQRSNLIEKNGKLIITNKVDPQILGGLVIDLGEKTIDLSVSSKITKLNRILAEAI
ncbi:ATP synthase F0 subcomplex subunit OSCP atp5 [Rhizophlyctis rosea]|uniref:ATP synthase subunit 5, mitochondrial n=1 Tax=Rhizophlyctis rosea TaxID=64517 RepID=A0AAD5SIC4_9FUNG|nr:ATP synthase F0 subcomplex subunit OSCP atp5 [Rhizophlyctis rosea]